ncbi:uncharacterized protein SRS1_14040 [Sporisorium reilianum f. sp. reilianum]|uniref:RlpA-like protein double-psi beta-barrel domain-containing protein n=1 Tax=Sporisorium reilianum f. sp. reilianum TaxID=72559 RepID=A0A2N8UE13_9BASI|nr:uncharacterized protein SRS1_14040 [Sporisorium reilianum f. sp. reilianum]
MRFTTLALYSSLIVAAASAHISTLNAASSSSGSSLLLARSDAAAVSVAADLALQKRAEAEEVDVEVVEDDEGDEDEEEVEVDIEARGKKHRKAHHRSQKHKGGRRSRKHHKHHSKSKPKEQHAQTHQAYTGGSFQGKGTFFNPDQGACGKWNTGADKIVALSSDIYQGGAHCFEGVRICHAGKCVNAKVADLCPGCKHTSLDMSPSLFKELASSEVGVIDIQWSFV